MSNIGQINIERIKGGFKSHKLIIANFGYLTIIQVINLLLPLLTYPYLIKTLGVEVYGVIIYSQVIMGYLVVLINFGFNITATKEISLNRENKLKIKEISSSILTIKGLLFIISCIILYLILAYSDNLKNHKLLLYLTLWMCIYEFLFPLWFFQGIEKMKYITFLTLFSRLIFATLVFVLVKNKNDYLLVPAINGLGAITACIIAFAVAKKEGMRLEWQHYNVLIKYIKIAYVMAISYALNIFKTGFSIIIIKNFFTYSQVAYFDLAIKITNIFITFLDLISQAVFPRMSVSKDLNFLKRILLIALIISILMVIFLQLFAEIIVDKLGAGDMHIAIELTKLMALNLPVYIVGAILGRNCLLIHGYSKEILMSMLVSGTVYLILVAAYTLTVNEINLKVFVLIYLTSFFIETAYRYWSCQKNRLI